MSNSTFIKVSTPDYKNFEWIENTQEKISDAVVRGLICRSVHEFVYPPSSDKTPPQVYGDLWIESALCEDVSAKIIAMRKMLLSMKYEHPDLNIDMFHYYIEHTGRILIQIPSIIFGGEMPCILQQRYHLNMIGIFVNYVSYTDAVEVYSVGRNGETIKKQLEVEKLINNIWPYSHNLPLMWIPPEHSTEQFYTVELDMEYFMNEDPEEIWRMVSRKNYDCKINTIESIGAPLEDIYREAQYLGIFDVRIEHRMKSIENCEVYKKIVENPDTLSEAQIEASLELLASLGIEGYKISLKMFQDKIGYIKERLHESILDFAYERRIAKCEELKKHFGCSGKCGVYSPYYLEEKYMTEDVLQTKYMNKKDGLYYSPSGFEKDDALRISSPLEIVGKICNAESKNWGRLVIVKAPDDATHRLIISMDEVLGTAEALLSKLINYGLELDSISSGKYVKQYLTSCHPKKIIKTTDIPGWHEHRYVLPEQTISYDDVQISYTGEAGKFQEIGSLSEWQNRIVLCHSINVG